MLRDPHSYFWYPRKPPRKEYCVPSNYPFPKQTIVVAVRTLNEQENIERFCEAYRTVDRIIIADGGSTDNTLDLARQFLNTEIHHFPRSQKLLNGMPFNAEGAHTDFVLSIAKQHNPDWLLWDDCDSTPNPFLQSNLRFLLQEHPYPVAFVQRAYMWHDGRYFPRMTCGYSLWGWNPSAIDIHGDTTSVLHPKLLGVPYEKENAYFLGDPSRLLHYCWNSEQEVARKMEFYAAQGRPEAHPLQRCGELEYVRDWMAE